MYPKTKTDVRRFLDIMHHNLISLEYNLIEMGYQFKNANGAIQLADCSDRRIIESMNEERELSTLYYHWYLKYRSIDFSQHPMQLEESCDEKVAGLGLNCPLIFLDISSCLELRQQMEAVGYSVCNEQGKHFIPTGGTATNCVPKGVWIPDSAIDPILYNEGAGPIQMSVEICHALESGGFPFWNNLFQRKCFTSPLDNTPAYEELKPLLLRNIKLN